MGLKKWKVKTTPEFENSLERLFSFNLRYLIPRLVENARYEIKWFFQRGFRGYDDRMVFSFYSQFAELAVKVLIHYRKIQMSLPIGMSEKEWNKIVDKIIEAFKAVPEIHEATWDMDKAKLKELKKTFIDGMDLLKEHYQNLWD